MSLVVTKGLKNFLKNCKILNFNSKATKFICIGNVWYSWIKDNFYGDLSISPPPSPLAKIVQGKIVTNHFPAHRNPQFMYSVQSLV